MKSGTKGNLCEFCDGQVALCTIRARFHFKGQTIYIDNVPAWVCQKCHEQYFDAPVYKRLEEIAHNSKQIKKIVSFPLAVYDMAIM
jgi:YgiT-type zinc finger domain-containing protein